MPSILLFHASADLYGSDQTILDLVEGLVDAGWRVEVALPRTGPLVAALEARGARLHLGGFSVFGRSTLRPAGLLAFPFQLLRSRATCLRLIRRLQPALVHVNTLVIPAPALAAKRAGVPLVWHVHEIMTRPQALARQLARLVQRLAQRVPCNSRATLEQLADYAPAIRAKALVVSNGVRDLEPLPREALRRSMQIPSDRFVFLFVGRLNAWKGQELFVEAAARIAAQHPEALFLAAGDAPDGQPGLRESFLARIEASGLGTAFRWLGFQAETHALYCAADALVVPSLLPEPFGLVAAEAMAASLAVIAAGHGGLLDIVEPQHTGLHFTPGDPQALAQAMQRLLSDREATRAMGRAGKQRQLEHFSVARYQEQFLELYRSLAEEPALR